MVTTLDVIGDLVTGISSVAEDKVQYVRKYYDQDHLTF